MKQDQVNLHDRAYSNMSDINLFFQVIEETP